MPKLPEDLRERALHIVRTVEAPTTTAIPQYPGITDDETEDSPSHPDDPVIGMRYESETRENITGSDYEWAKNVLAVEGSKADMVREKPPRPNVRTEANGRLQFAVQMLFSLDRDKLLTVDVVKQLPLVQEWADKQGLSDDSLRRLVQGVAPQYAHPRPGPKDPWESSPSSLKITR